MYKAYPEQDFVDVADAIRTKTGKSAKLEFPDEFISEIEDISGGEVCGFDLYTADSNGDNRSNTGVFDNNYLVCFFHDNMDSYYNLNGVRHDFPVSIAGNGLGRILGDAVSVINPAPSYDDYDGEIIQKRGLSSLFTCHHNDHGSYISVVGGWVGYPSGGSIYKQAVNTALNSITMDSAHETLLIFVGASASNLESANTIDINGNTYEITNIGTTYDNVENAYGALKINNNTSSIINVTFPVSCYNFVAIIGIDS